MLKKEKVCCYFPTTTVFIDDDEKYLKSLSLELDDNLISKIYSNPLDALKFLKEKYRYQDLTKKWICDLEELEIEELEKNQLTHRAIDIDISKIRNEIYSPKRFDEISLIVVDYSMPQINGLDLCRSLGELPFKKILLTGATSQEIAIKAFNDKIIDKFIEKSSDDFTQILHKAIYDLQYDYFKDLSKVIISNVSVRLNTCLLDSDFWIFFNKFILDHCIVEYYLVSDSGCFLMLDIDGNSGWLLVKSENDMIEYTDVAKDHYAPKNIFNDLKSRKKILFFLTQEEEQNTSVDKWDEYMHPAEKLIFNDNIYYYSYVKNASIYDIRSKEIISYQNYLDLL